MEAAVARMPTGLYELHLQGRSSNPYWIASLFSGLSELGVSIVSGTAVQNAQSGWNARIALNFRGAQARPDGIDYAALVKRRFDAGTLEPPQLSDFAVAVAEDRSLEITVSAPDQVGFVGRLLLKIASLALFPVELDITTVAGLIRDRIVLRGIGRAAPGEEVRKSLQILLGRMKIKSAATAPS
ncbi:MAG: hypothetical protein P4L83_21325 [Nevskia sp.]|nr:hypothetical protein [Nevskia sp.]